MYKLLTIIYYLLLFKFKNITSKNGSNASFLTNYTYEFDVKNRVDKVTATYYSNGVKTDTDITTYTYTN